MIKNRFRGNLRLGFIIFPTVLLAILLMYLPANIPSFAASGFGAHAEEFNIAKGMIIVGMSFTVILFSAVLYAGKRTETYLIWLAILSYTTMIRTAMNTFPFLADYPLLNIFLLGKLQYLGPEHSAINSDLHRVIMAVFVGYLRYRLMKTFFNTRILGHPYFIYAASAALPVFFCAGSPYFLHAIALMYIVMYACELTVLLCSGPEQQNYAAIIVFAWSLTVALRTFDFLCSFGVLPGNYLVISRRFNGIIESFFSTAFFIIACMRFAGKFREADLLNRSLETKIKEKTREKTALVRSLLHNLKTPLFSLSGYADILESSISPSDEASLNYLSKMNRSIEYVSRLLERVFLITQLDDGLVAFQAVPFDLLSIAEKVADATALKAAGRKIRVTADGKSFPCYGDPLYLEMAVQNLADNALDYTSESGNIELSLSSGTDFYRLCVMDDGEGIPPENIDRIFDRYFSDHHGRRNSSGLGLSIAKELIAGQGGTIHAESTPGVRTVFTINIPVDKNS